MSEHSIRETSRMLLRRILHLGSEAEEQKLREWEKQGQAERQVAEHLKDSEWLTSRYVRLRQIDTERPMKDMERRIADAGHTVERRSGWRVWATAASLLFAVGLGGYLWFGSDDENQSVAQYVISHGTTQAQLTFGDGRTVDFDQDMSRTQQLFSQLIENAGLHEGSGGADELCTLSTPRGGEFEVTLSDGTTIWLNAESELQYPLVFEGEERRVKVKGETFLKVAHDERPFIVETGRQQIRVMGTEFNVNAYPESDAIYTTLVEGSIKLTVAGDSTVSVVLEPGQQAVVSVADGDMEVAQVDTEFATAWRRGQFVFENQRLDQLMQTLSRWYDFSYSFDDNSLKQTTFMGSVPRYGDFADVLRVIEICADVKITVDGRQLRVARKN